MMRFMKRLVALFAFLWLALSAFAQTDETIFREFQFDFSTPGARANAMGRAFVALADEATAAYNNPAGLSVLRKPEFSLEFRVSESRFDALESDNRFLLLDGTAKETTQDLSSITFASFSVSRGNVNFSAFFVNHLDYERPPINESTEWERDDDFDFYTFTYINQHHVRNIEINTYGLSFSRRFGKLSLGASVGLSNLDVDYSYFTSLTSFDIGFSDRVESSARDQSYKPTYVLGTLYQMTPKLRLALSYKRQPRFVFNETISTNAVPAETPLSVAMKVPDSFELGISFQPNDFWTVVLESDWVQYQQLSDNFTVLSALDAGLGDLFRFEADDYRNNNDPEVHAGVEYLLPLKRHILAFRAGAFTENDHKTRFVGEPGPAEDPRVYAIQDFVFNTGDRSSDVGYTLGLGYVWNSKLQFDVALVEADRFRWVVSSFLYRF